MDTLSIKAMTKFSKAWGLVLVVGAIAFIGWTKPFKDRSDEYHLEAAMNAIFEFYPKWPREKCMAFVNTPSGLEDDDRILMALQKAWREDRRVPLADIVSEGGSNILVLLFADRCDETQQMARTLIHRASKYIPGVFLSLSMPSAQWPFKRVHTFGELWIDSPDYDASYWDMRKAARAQQTAQAWLRLAEYHAHHTLDEGRANVYASLSFLLAEQKEDREKAEAILQKLSQTMPALAMEHNEELAAEYLKRRLHRAPPEGYTPARGFWVTQ